MLIIEPSKSYLLWGGNTLIGSGLLKDIEKRKKGHVEWRIEIGLDRAMSERIKICVKKG
jgi:hypothetical protein